MRILLDEDCPGPLLRVLRHLLPRHTVDLVTELKWSGKKDIHVLADAKRHHYDMIVTKDRNQLDDPDECNAIKKARLHHVRFRQRRKGMEGLALAIGAVISAMPSLLTELEKAEGQRLAHIAGLNPDGRFEITDPRKTPPSKYWPR